MPLQFPRLPRSLLYPRPIRFENFAGGLNLKDDPASLGAGETPECLNFIFDEAGKMRRRFGFSNFVSGLSSLRAIFYWPSKSVVVYQNGTTLYKNPAVPVLVATFTTSAAAAMTEFNGKLVVVHPVDGVFDYDGTTWTSRSATVKGTCIAAWQNKLWVGGDSANPSRVWYSNAGSSATWTTASDFVDLREVDDRTITAIGGGNGMDIAGRPALLVYKAFSTYRINNSTNGSYTTLSGSAGCASPNGVTTSHGLTCAVASNGIWATDGLSPPELISENVQSLFNENLSQFPTQATFPNVSATVTQEGRFLFSFQVLNPAAGTFDNWYSLEWDPVRKWWTMHTFGFPYATTYSVSGFTRPMVISRARSEICYQDPTTFQDQAVDIKASWLSPWIEPFTGRNSLLQTVSIRGNSSAAFTLEVLKNLQTSSTSYAVPAFPVSSGVQAQDVVMSDFGSARHWAVRLSSTDSFENDWTSATTNFPTSQAKISAPTQISELGLTFYLQGLAF